MPKYTPEDLHNLPEDTPVRLSEVLDPDVLAQFDQVISTASASLDLLFDYADTIHHELGSDWVIPGLGERIWSTVHDLGGNTDDPVMKQVLGILLVSVRGLVDLSHQVQESAQTNISLGLENEILKSEIARLTEGK